MLTRRTSCCKTWSSPDMDGFELVKQLRALPGGADVPIIAFSALLDGLGRIKATGEGFTDYLFKPVGVDDLLGTVQSYLPIHKTEAGPGNDYLILIADDNPIQLKIMKIKLEQMGFRVVALGDGDSLLRQARSTRPDAIISDVLMPGLDGFRLCHAVRQDPQLANVPVVLVSAAYVEDEDLKLAEKVGADAFVARNPELQELTDALLATLISHRKRGPTQAVELPVEYTHRVIRQLERQIAVNAGLTQRLVWQEAQLSTLNALAQAVQSNPDMETILQEMLYRSVDTSSASSAVVYLIDTGGSFSIGAQIGYMKSDEEQLRTFFGRSDLYARY